ncbi:MAG: DNA polymerase III subunit gamma/tau [Pseudomonadota bacterium]|nr:DNA polymerase III subunit gamma/tau [Pseudomonadota bacterium]
MSYQVLARKWRPRAFGELVGQEHVVTALTNALTRGRLHHAYLLTGTRGVGKTTLARILAKSLNCEKGVSATPCGECSACCDIDAGRFVDLLELDAASNTGVENMREILDNARYAPTVGRYKVYLIDEVHMLSRGAFNSMLKTLEEPPEHVKFVLATTDPQKIPVTVLSRCLQFSLTPLPRASIVERLAHILGAEAIAFDAPALPLLAAAAQGSLRDALSLLDQAIAYGGGDVREPAVRTMLGVVDRDYLYRIVDALLVNDGLALLAQADALAANGHAFPSALDELASLFHRVAVVQAVPGAPGGDDSGRIADYAARMSPESVQLAYQICVQGRSDLALAPDEATGFTMTLLRLLAFEPTSTGALAPPIRAADDRARSTQKAPVTGPPARGRADVDRNVGPIREAAAPSGRRPETPDAARLALPSAQPGDNASSNARSASPPLDKPPLALPEAGSDWPGFVAKLRLAGMAAQLAAQSELKSIRGNALSLAIPPTHKHLADKAYADKLKAALEAATGRKLLLAFEIGDSGEGSLAAIERRERAQARAEGEAAFRNEPFVRELVARFDATVKPETIEPVTRDASTPSTRQETP